VSFCQVEVGSSSAGFGLAINPLIGTKSPDFLRPKPDLLPAKAGVVMPSQAGSTTAYRSIAKLTPPLYNPLAKGMGLSHLPPIKPGWAGLARTAF
jgi:hypothetical protein